MSSQNLRVTYTASTFKKYCDQLRSKHTAIQLLHQKYGYPPYWKRENCFASLCKTILEQQVSLASAKSVYEKLHAHSKMSPSVLAELSQADYLSFGVTRQKATYLSLLAKQTLGDQEFFTSLEEMDNETLRKNLLCIKGIGPWTANVYMLTAINRLDIYPDNDVALMSSIAYEAMNQEKLSNENAAAFIAQFTPMRSIASCYYYHAYIVRKKISFIP